MGPPVRLALVLPLRRDPWLSVQPLARECVRDYSVQCPEGFEEQATDCIATPDYTGPCSRKQPELFLLSSTAKTSWASVCKANYPCMPDRCPAGAEYSQPCPIGWYEGSNGRCSTEDPLSQCNQAITAAADHTAKVTWEKTCGVRWPCKKKTCIKDFVPPCPAEWTHVGSDICEAPSTYQGPCGRRMDMSAYKGRTDLKRALEMRCGLSWVCKSSTHERERDFSVPCPLGWTVLEDSSCRAPTSYTSSENCPRVISFVGRPVADRQSYAALCNMDFPFRGK